MGEIVPYEKLPPARQTQVAGQTLGNVLSAGQAIICDINSAFPAITHAEISLGDDVPQVHSDAILDRLCGSDPTNFPPPLPPGNPFQGGQCPCAVYRVQGTYSYRNGEVTGTFDVLKRGPIGGLSVISRQDAQDLGFYQGAPQCGGRTWFSVVLADNDSGDASGLTGTTSSVVRDDGNPDNCGDPPAQYPPIVPPPNQLTQNYNITIGPNTINMPVSFGSVNLTANAYFAPSYTVQVGNLTLSFGLEGVEVNVSPSFNVNPTFPTIPDSRNPPFTPLPQPSASVDLSGVYSRLTNLQSDVDDLMDCDRCNDGCTNDSRYTAQQFSTVQAGEFTLPTLSRWVVLNVTQIASNARRSSGHVNTQEIVYCGWFGFACGQDYLPQEKVTFGHSLLKVPEGATKFVLNLYPAFLGQSTVIHGSNTPPP